MSGLHLTLGASPERRGIPKEWGMRINPRPGTREIQIDGDLTFCPEELTARVTPRGKDSDLPAFSADVSIKAGRPICTGLRVIGDGEALTGEFLRRIPVAALAREAVAYAATKRTRDREQGIGRGLEWEGERLYVLDDAQGTRPRREKLRAGFETGQRQPREAIPVDLEQVAQEYRDALTRGEHPTKTLVATHTVGRATASRWVRRCRDAGYLGEARTGTAGEQSTGKSGPRDR